MSAPTLLLAGGAVLLLTLGAFRSGAKAGSVAASRLHATSQMGGLLARSLMIGAVIVGFQVAVITGTDDWRAWAAVLGIPALLAGATVARVFTVTSLVHTDRGPR